MVIVSNQHTTSQGAGEFSAIARSPPVEKFRTISDVSGVPAQLVFSLMLGNPVPADEVAMTIRNTIPNDGQMQWPVDLLAELLLSAEKECTAFYFAIGAFFGCDQARMAVEDWLREFEEMEWLPGPHHHIWHHLTQVAVSRLAERISHPRLVCADTEIAMP